METMSLIDECDNKKAATQKGLKLTYFHWLDEFVVYFAIRNSNGWLWTTWGFSFCKKGCKILWEDNGHTGMRSLQRLSVCCLYVALKLSMRSNGKKFRLSNSCITQIFTLDRIMEHPSKVQQPTAYIYICIIHQFEYKDVTNAICQWDCTEGGQTIGGGNDKPKKLTVFVCFPDIFWDYWLFLNYS